MECPRENGTSVELMMAYTAGTLEPEAQIALDRHMSVCQDCRDMAAEQKAVWDALDAWKPAPVSADFNARLYQKISEAEVAPWWQRLFRINWSWVLRPAVPVAAACATLVIAFLVKAPAVTHSSPVSSQQKVSIEQVERALDDMDMLKQISVPAPAEGPSTERI
jgi:anti-sigma factor RsiW